MRGFRFRQYFIVLGAPSPFVASARGRHLSIRQLRGQIGLGQFVGRQASTYISLSLYCIIAVQLVLLFYCSLDIQIPVYLNISSAISIDYIIGILSAETYDASLEHCCEFRL